MLLRDARNRRQTGMDEHGDRDCDRNGYRNRDRHQAGEGCSSAEGTAIPAKCDMTEHSTAGGYSDADPLDGCRAGTDAAGLNRRFQRLKAASWFSFGARRLPMKFAVVLLALTPALAGCGGTGFRPMYAAQAGGEALSTKMAQVRVTHVPGRVGQRLRNELIFQTTGGGEALEQQYRLDIVLRERLTSQLVNVEGNAESQIYHLDADFQLTDTKRQEVVLKGSSFGRAGFQRFQTIYSNVRAKQDAENRTARTVALDMKGRIEAFLSR